MWVWSKLAAVKWEDAWEERFYGNRNAVLTRLKGGRSVRLDVYCEEEGEAVDIAAQFGGSVKEVADRNWAAFSAVPGPPIKIRDSLLLTTEVTPSRLRELLLLNEGRVVMSIPPEMAFGTGDHPTTAACLRFLADEARARKRGRWRMLDLGCGSGVLAIAANLLGAEECEALDFDRKAVEIARHNVERNGAQEVRVNFELRELLISGYVRPADISRQNEIAYDRIAAARISYGGRGQITDVQQPRYGQQVADIILPF